jgi:hypothetical protein
VAEEDERDTTGNGETEAPTQDESGEEGLGTRTGAVDGPEEGGTGLGQEEGGGDKDDLGQSGRGRH